ncbi:MAG: YihY/virulence factor BrkB family protein [Solirubrobacterales bacterium]
MEAGRLSAPTPSRVRDRDRLERADIGELVRELVACFRRHSLLVAGGGIALRTMLATVTGSLALLGVLGFFDLTEVWRSNVAPDLRDSVSPAAFRLLDDAVTTVLTSRQIFWATVGTGLAVWQISGVVRACGQTLNRIDGVTDDRSLLREFGESLLAGALIAVLLLVTLAVVRLGPLAVDAAVGDGAVIAVASFVVRWSIAAALLGVAVALVGRVGPAREQPGPWITLGSALTVVGWVLTSIAFGAYLTGLASFGSLYGGLLALFLLVEYLYVAAVVFLGGMVLDRLLERG